ncbi:MAG: HIT family protein [Acidimicrobiales bacterium]|jgi:histidine triad (HIT) family protein|nr:hypothetical protein [Actinomycetota bacterium]MDP6176634.1 HIT family protein [Acidimicrobiales bacterium]MDP6282012.1 HIT family protein [Acidimicrobiales bacterium]MDP7117444.1 HIT family protein [Acidimicrobiales bacterium]MDP7410497.1 HIT family protein [Acidimicrobiales bacterium]|tara:strand:+ start:431 stop:850 length:420 start_codon:yes stop_codon:yes gene_type:complete
MASIFTRIIQGEIPGRIIWRDDHCVAMVDIRPLHRGHVLVIPVSEVDRWTDLPAETATHCLGVAHSIGRAQQEALAPERVGLIVAGFEVPHAHIHVVPIDDMTDLDFSRADTSADPLDLDLVADELRDTLLAHGHGCVT